LISFIIIVHVIMFLFGSFWIVMDPHFS